jgi:hypothetical protein
MRDALPFSVREIFLIQSGSALLLAHIGSDPAIHPDLISGMLTVVRDFMHDSFAQGDGPNLVDEIQYGEQRIIVQDGRLCHLAVVIHGIEPAGFRGELRRFLNRLQTEEYARLQAFNGEMDDLATIPPAIERLAGDLQSMAAPANRARPLSRGQKLIIGLGGLGGVLLLGLACFYFQFTLALLPVAFGDPSPTVTITSSSTPTATPTFTPTSTATATATATASPTPTATPTATATTTALPTATIVPFAVVTNRTVLAFSEPNLDSELVAPIAAGMTVTLLEIDAPWLLVEWQSESGLRQGWLSVRWVDLAGTPPADFPPTPEP